MSFWRECPGIRSVVAQATVNGRTLSGVCKDCGEPALYTIVWSRDEVIEVCAEHLGGNNVVRLAPGETE